MALSLDFKAELPCDFDAKLNVDFNNKWRTQAPLSPKLVWGEGA